MAHAIDMDFDSDLPALFQHSRRPDWGLAILAWEGDNQRGYQFEDGRLRTFKKGYYHLLTEIDRPVEEVERVVDELARRLDLVQARTERAEEAKKRGRRLTTLDEQLGVFRRLFPEGFNDPVWAEDIRGIGVSHPRKKHRSPVIEMAKELLAEADLRAALEAGEPERVMASVISLLERTDLVQPKDVKPLSGIAGDDLKDTAEAIVEMLYGKAPWPDRFGTFLKTLTRVGITARWELATVLPALLKPDDHLAVRPSVVRLQARWMAPRLKMESEPNVREYGRLRTMARAIRRRLKEAEMEPRDLMDVYDFMWHTLRPAAQSLLEEVRA